MNSLESLYIHFPFCRHLCNYCDFYKSLKENEQQVLEFNQAFLEMFDRHDQFLNEQNYEWAPLQSLYIGGGTPSLWGSSGAKLIKKLLQEKMKGLHEESEFTLEVNPGGWKEEDLEQWLESGVNRISFGVQAYNDLFLGHLDRVHRLKEVHQTLELLKKWNLNYSVDLMLGLPYSERDKRDIETELKEILKWDPPHLSVYILTTKNQYLHQQQLPSDEWIETEYLTTAKILKDHGYLHYEVSNFAKEGFESKHNLRYWNCQSVAALGPSATGLLVENKKRYKWKNKLGQFECEELSQEALDLEKTYLALRTNGGIRGSEHFSEEKLNEFQKIKNHWIHNQMALPEPGDKLVLNSQGFLQMDHLMNELFRIE